MIDLDRALTDLADNLDYPTGTDLTSAVRNRIANPPAENPAPENPAIRWQQNRLHETKTLPSDGREAGRRGRARMRVLVAVAAAIVVIVAAVVAASPARHAIADWIGIGAVEIRHSDTPLPNGSAPDTFPGAPSSAAGNTAAAARDLAGARARMQFPVKTPRIATAGALLGVQDDERVPGGLVALRYRDFSLTEIASDVNTGPVFAKVLGPGATATPISAAGESGFWIAGTHQVAYMNRNHQFEMDTVRRSGPVLVWSDGGVTYRIEGLRQLADAQAVANSLR